MLKIAIADDHKLFRKSLAALLSTFEGVEVVFETDSGKEFLELLKKHNIDLALLDIQMPEMDGYKLCEGVLKVNPDIKVLMISLLNKGKKSERLYRKLSSREIEVLRYLSEGKKNKEIAKLLDLNEKTISTYKLRLLTKLHVTNLVDLVNKAKTLDIV